MSEFEFIFALYALVLGLSFVELISGFGRTLELAVARDAAGRKFRIGWLTPLLGLFVLLDLTSFWAYAWMLREDIVYSYRTLLGTLALSGSYFLAARLVFPSDPEHFVDLDSHYFRIRRIVLGILLVLEVAQIAYLATFPKFSATVTHPAALIFAGILLAMMALAMWLRSKRANAIVLALMVARYLLAYLVA